MKLIFLLLVFFLPVKGDQSFFLPFNTLLKDLSVVRVDCYYTDKFTYIDSKESICDFISQNANLYTVIDQEFLNEVNLMLKKSRLVRCKNFVSPRVRSYGVYVLHFSDGATVSLLSSSSFGENRFVFVNWYIEGDQRKLEKIDYLLKSKNKTVEAALFLPSFRESKLFAFLINRAKETNKQEKTTGR